MNASKVAMNSSTESSVGSSAITCASDWPNTSVQYQRWRPEETTLNQVVQGYLESFLAQVWAETGASLPDFVEDEFDAFLECGIPRLGGGGANQPKAFCACAAPSARMRSW
jgi:hypothetical protein